MPTEAYALCPMPYAQPYLIFVRKAIVAFCIIAFCRKEEILTIFTQGNERMAVPDLFIPKKPVRNRVSWLTSSRRLVKNPVSASAAKLVPPPAMGSLNRGSNFFA
jgi:hypothetical protein